MDKYDVYRKAVNALEMSKQWNELPKGQKYQNDKMDISPAHCTLKLVRSGQQVQGGQNYWDAPPELVAEILDILKEDKTIIERALIMLSRKATNLLVECEQETLERMKQIQKAKEENE